MFMGPLHMLKLTNADNLVYAITGASQTKRSTLGLCNIPSFITKSTLFTLPLSLSHSLSLSLSPPLSLPHFPLSRSFRCRAFLFVCSYFGGPPCGAQGLTFPKPILISQAIVMELFSWKPRRKSRGPDWSPGGPRASIKARCFNSHNHQ